MPYNETPTQAMLYYDIGVEAFERGNNGTARSHLTLARAIAEYNNMYDLIRKIDNVLSKIK